MHKICMLLPLALLSIACNGNNNTIPAGTPIDSIVVLKSQRELRVYNNYRLLKTYKVALGEQPIGPKHFEGDMKTPEGLYHIYDKNPNSDYHKNLGISYPNATDRAYAAKNGKPAGGSVKIHGLKNGKGYIGAAHRLTDWTHGCIALTDEEVDEIYSHTAIGTPINILP